MGEILWKLVANQSKIMHSFISVLLIMKWKYLFCFYESRFHLYLNDRDKQQHTHTHARNFERCTCATPRNNTFRIDQAKWKKKKKSNNILPSFEDRGRFRIYRNIFNFGVLWLVIESVCRRRRPNVVVKFTMLSTFVSSIQHSASITLIDVCLHFVILSPFFHG